MKTIVTFLLILLVGGCAAKAPPEHHAYLLPTPSYSPPADDRNAIRLLPVAIAPYLDQQGIVLQTEGDEVHVARQYRWAEPLNASVNRYLQVALANAAGRVVEVSPLTTGGVATEVRVRIQQLHGSTGGDVRLVAEWTVTAPSGAPALHAFDASAAQRSDGYPALIEAHAALLDRLALAIAGSLEGGSGSR